VTLGVRCVPERLVIIVSRDDDVHARAVRSRLELRGVETVLLDFAEFPEERSSIHLCGPGRSTIVLGDLATRPDREWAVWFRRPQPHRLAQGLSQDYADYTQRATRTALIGALASAATCFINRPEPFGLIYNKPFQIELAKRSGLPVPETLVTNDPDAAKDFVARHSGAMVKSPVTWKFRMLETRMIMPGSDFDYTLVRLCPIVLQAPLTGGREYRVTIVGEQIFTAATELGGGAFQPDSRLGERADFVGTDLPQTTEHALRAFHAASGLEYGAYDLRCDADGLPHFLEVNPDGQYLFVEIEAGLPISDALAERLATAVRPPLPS
jgi:hypothetical protein